MDIPIEDPDLIEQSPSLLSSIKNTLELYPGETYILCLRFIASYSSSKSRIPPEAIIELAKGFVNGKSYKELSREMRFDVNYHTLRNIDNVLKRAFYMISEGPDSPNLSKKDKTIAERFKMYPLLLDVIQEPEIDSLLTVIPHYRDLLVYIANGYSLYDFINNYTGAEIPNIVELVYYYNKHLLNLFARPSTTSNNRTMHVIAKYVAFRRYARSKCTWFSEGNSAEKMILDGLIRICELPEKRRTSLVNSNNGSYIIDLLNLINNLPVIENKISNYEQYKNPYEVNGINVLKEGRKYEGVLPKFFLMVIDRLANFKTVDEIAEEIAQSIHYNKNSVSIMIYPLVRYIENILTFPSNTGLKFQQVLLVNQADVVKEAVTLIREKLKEKTA